MNYYNPYANAYAGANNNQMIWVQGEAGAKSYLVAPNTSIALWDSEASVIYIKSADASGMPSMKVLDYTVRDMSKPTQDIPLKTESVDYVTHKELSALENRIKKQISKLSKEADSDDE